MPPSFHLPEPSTPVARPTAQQEDFKSRPPTARKAPMSSCPKKPTKGGGKAKVAPKKRGKKRGKQTKVVEEESSGETVIVTDIKDVTVDEDLEDPDSDSGDDGGISAEGETDVSEYKEKSLVVKRSSGKRVSDKGTSSKTSSGRKTTTGSGGLARKVHAGKSASAKSPKKEEVKSAPGRKGKAKAGNTAGENSNLLDDFEAGYYPDGENDENDENCLENSKTPAKRSARKVTGGSAGRGTASKTARKTASDRKATTKATVKEATKSSRGTKAPVEFEGKSEQEGSNSDLVKEPPITTATKRKASRQEDSRFKKVAKKASTKSVGAIKSGIESLSLGRVDDSVDEADESMGQFFGDANKGCIVRGGTSEQRTAIIAAASNSQSLSVVQSEPVIGKRRLNYGGKSVAGLQKLWKKGLPEHL